MDRVNASFTPWLTDYLEVLLEKKNLTQAKYKANNTEERSK